VEQVPATVTQTYNLVCERTWMASLLGSVFYVGFAMGSLLTGAVGDRYGRRFGLIGTPATTVRAQSWAGLAPSNNACMLPMM